MSLLRMDKFLSLNKRNSFLVNIPVVFFSMFLIAAISPIGIENNNNNALAQPFVTCDEVDDQSGGECKQIYKNSKGGFPDCVNNPNCIHEQTVFVDNELDSPDEEAKILQSVEQYLKCGNPNCLNVDDDPEATFEGLQHLGVGSSDDSVVDFDVEMKAKQQVDGKGEQPYSQSLTSDQDFSILAFDDAEIDADGKNDKIQLVLIKVMTNVMMPVVVVVTPRLRPLCFRNIKN